MSTKVTSTSHFHRLDASEKAAAVTALNRLMAVFPKAPIPMISQALGWEFSRHILDVVDPENPQKFGAVSRSIWIRATILAFVGPDLYWSVIAPIHDPPKYSPERLAITSLGPLWMPTPTAATPFPYDRLRTLLTSLDEAHDLACDYANGIRGLLPATEEPEPT